MTLKEQLFNKTTITMFLKLIDKYYPLNVEHLTNELVDTMKTLELKERMTALRKTLEREIKLDYLEVLRLFDKVMLAQKEEHFVFASILEYVESNGLSKEHADESLKRLGEYTKVFTAELAIRSFLNDFEEETLVYIRKWSLSTDYHKRRLASEGTRPSLPWAKKIGMEYSESISWLNNLYYDSERYVTRSVANHLNDISKIDPELVVKTLGLWQKENKQTKKEMEYIVSHSLRTLIKKGNPLALEFLGYNMNAVLLIKNLHTDKKIVNTGDSIMLKFDIHSLDDKLIVDYIVHFQSKSGRASRKVYKLKQISKSGITHIEKKVAFNQRSTRKIYPGVHLIEIQINGKIVGSVTVTVTWKILSYNNALLLWEILL